MGKISRLSTHLSNLIAAGEVVERPSSVVKELVENSIDANASKIIISLVDSGTKEINIIDDGEGMSKEDAKEAFGRHSTSKIKSEYDLSRILTLGFRGEAIPSIASVSHIKILTNDGSGGYEVVYKAGDFVSSEEKACSKGTNILVKDLFFNTPARLKYLKSLSSELASIVFLVSKFALSFPNISFTLTNNNKEIIKTSGNNDLVRLFGELYGLETAKSLIFKEQESLAYKVKLILAKPSVSRVKKDEITVIANNRYVKSYPITNALIEGYHTFLPNNRYPIACIYLEIDPTLVDVNVHPSKQIIKISNESEICELVTKLSKETLEATDNTAQATLLKESAPKNDAYIKQDIFATAPINEIVNKKEENINITNIINVAPKTPTTTNVYNKVEEIFTPKYNPIRQNPKVFSEEVAVYNKFSNMRYIGCMHATYLIFENEEGLCLVDQHAAAERIKYEQFYNIISEDKKILEELLIPYSIEFSKDEVIMLEEHTEIFNELGFEFDLLGENSIVVRVKPNWCHIDDIDTTMETILKYARSNKKLEKLIFLDDVCKSLSCKGSIKANKVINDSEIKTLMQDLEKCLNPYKCPHGRPTLVKISEKEILKMFKRL